MPELNLNDIIGTAYEGTGDTSDETPESPEVETESTPTATSTETGSPETGDSEEDEELFDWETIKDPKELKAAKHFQAAYTKARQRDKAQLDEKIKTAKFSGVHPDVAKLAEELDQLVKIDPSGNLARQRLSGAQQNGQQQQPAPPVAQSPTLNPELLNDPYLGPALQPILQRQAELERAHIQQQIASYEVQINKEFDSLQDKHWEIPMSERQAVLQYGLQNGYPSVTAAWKALNEEKIIAAKVEQKAREVSAVVQRKASAAPPPSTTQSRKVSSDELPTDNLKDLVGAIYDRTTQ